MTMTLFRSKSCGGLPRPKLSFSHYSSNSSNQLDNEDDEDEDDDVCYYFNNNNNSPITTPFISPRQQQKGPTNDHNQSNQNLTIASILLAALRKSLLTSCTVVHDSSSDDVSSSLDIGCPTNVQHVSHVTFDRFNGFLGLPLAFQPEIPGKVPSASGCVFGVSVESMQCSYDERGNSVPTILLMMQKRLYSGGGLQAEGIFRISGENSQAEDVRKQLNRGFVPHEVDVHCLAGLIKAWFRELPTGVLDTLTPQQVMHCNTEEECSKLAESLPPTEAALLDWAINLMADVVMFDNVNKMNARNIAMVFAPNMTQMADPLTALIHAVQIMNLLKTLVMKTIREREESSTDFERVSSCAACPPPNNKLDSSYSLRTATLNRLGSESEEQFWSFPRKSGSIVECDCMLERSLSNTSTSDPLKSDHKSKQQEREVVIEGILERLSLKKGVRKLCRYPVFQLKSSKKNGNMVMDDRDGGEAWG